MVKVPKTMHSESIVTSVLKEENVSILSRGVSRLEANV